MENHSFQRFPSALIIGLDSVGVEVALSIAQSQHPIDIYLYDNCLIEEIDCWQHIFFKNDDIGRRKDDVLIQFFHANFSSTGQKLAVEPEIADLELHSIVIMANARLDKAIAFNEHCRACGIGFVAVETRGSRGFVFADFGGQAQSFREGLVAPKLQNIYPSSYHEQQQKHQESSLQMHVVFQAMHMFQMQEGFRVDGEDEEHIAEVLRLAREWCRLGHVSQSLQVDIDERKAKMIISQSRMEFPPLWLLLGGVAAHRAIEGVLKGYPDVTEDPAQWLYLDLLAGFSLVDVPAQQYSQKAGIQPSQACRSLPLFPAAESLIPKAKILLISPAQNPFTHTVYRCLASMGFQSIFIAEDEMVDKERQIWKACRHKDWCVPELVTLGISSSRSVLSEQCGFKFWDTLGAVVICSGPISEALISKISQKCLLHRKPLLWLCNGMQGKEQEVYSVLKVALPDYTTRIEDRQGWLKNSLRAHNFVQGPSLNALESRLVGSACVKLIEILHGSMEQNVWDEVHGGGYHWLERTLPPPPSRTCSDPSNIEIGGCVRAIPEGFTAWDQVIIDNVLSVEDLLAFLRLNMGMDQILVSSADPIDQDPLEQQNREEVSVNAMINTNHIQRFRSKLLLMEIQDLYKTTYDRAVDEQSAYILLNINGVDEDGQVVLPVVKVKILSKVIEQSESKK